MKTVRVVVAIVAALSGGCQWGAPKSQSPRDDLEAALRAFLEDHGELCLGKTSWPVVVSAEDATAGTSDARQMPVLERLGLVQATPLVAATSYWLTDLGRRSYRERNPQGQGDLCAGKVALARIVQVDRQGQGAQATVRYTYRFDAFAWLRDAEAQQVFPAVAQLDAAQGQAVLEQRFVRRDGQWLPLDLRNVSDP
jgi:hypothetical protein